MVLLKFFEDHSGFLCYETTASNPFRSISGLYSEMEDLKKSRRFSTCIRVKAITITAACSLPGLWLRCLLCPSELGMCMVCWNVNWATSMAPIAGQNKCWCTGAPGLRAETLGLRSGQCTCEAGLHFACNKDEHTISYNMIQYVLCTYKL